MELHDTENAPKFPTETECLEWINSRIVRFKLKVQHGVDAEGAFAIGNIVKAAGRIVVTTTEEFESSSLDEPLGNYAFPLEQPDKTWLAVMGMSD